MLSLTPWLIPRNLRYSLVCAGSGKTSHAYELCKQRPHKRYRVLGPQLTLDLMKVRSTIFHVRSFLPVQCLSPYVLKFFWGAEIGLCRELARPIEA